MLTLDPQNYRNVTASLFPSPLAKDISLAKTAYSAQFGVWRETPVQLEHESFHQHDPSRLLFRSYRGAIEARAPVDVSDGEIAAWRDGVIDAIAPVGSVVRSDLLLCSVPVEHRWRLERLGVVLHPAPATAARPPMAFGGHPVMLRYSASQHASSSVTSMMTGRRLGQLSLLLNATTYLRCSHTMRVVHGWGWDPATDSRSRWVTLTYRSPELHDTAAIGEAAELSSEGRWVDDCNYYVGPESAVDGVASLPQSLDDTLSAADALPEEHHRLLLRACNLIHQADAVAHSSSSLSYVALASAVETLASKWQPSDQSGKAFRAFLEAMLPQYVGVAKAARRLYKLRCRIAHGGGILAGDDIEMRQNDDDEQEAAAVWALARVARLAIVNWIRTRSGLSTVPPER